MAGGISGIDVQSIVDRLMKFQTQGLNALNKQKSIYQSQQQGYTNLVNLLNEFQTQFNSFQTILNQNQYAIQSSNTSVASVALTSDQVPPGQYSLNVTQVATANQISSGAFTSDTTALNLSGNVDIAIGSNTLSLALNTTDTLQDISNNINSSLNNPGVTANILKATASNGSDEYYLVLTSDNTGTNYAMTISGSGSTALNLTNVLTAAQNAIFTFDGFNVVRDSNTVSDVIDGITFNINGTGSATFTITSDIQNQVTTVTTALQSMVSAYNDVMDLISLNQSESILRDGTYPLVQSALETLMYGAYGDGSIHHLFDLGITTASSTLKTNDENNPYVVTGVFNFDTVQFGQVLQDNLGDVRSFFNSLSDGLSISLDNAISNIEDNTISVRTKIIDQETRYIDDKIYQEQIRLDSLRQQLTKQYTAVEKIVIKYEAIGNFLDQQLSIFQSSIKK